jgi:hypothetical protein
MPGCPLLRFLTPEAASLTVHSEKSHENQENEGTWSFNHQD